MRKTINDTLSNRILQSLFSFIFKKKTYFIATVLILTSLSFHYSNSNFYETRGENDVNSNPIIDRRRLDINNISTWFWNDGSFNHHGTTGNAGFEWPKGSGHYSRYVSGLWLGAKVVSDTLITYAYYDAQYRPGYVNNSGIPMGNEDTLYRIYRIERGDTLSPDYLNWPVNQGAYVTSIGKPFFLGRQTMFYSFTDAYSQYHHSPPGNTEPLKAQVLQTNWAYTNVGLEDVCFTEFRIINRSNETWNNAFIGVWTDDDVGSADDDAPGVDSTRNLAYTYNRDNYDPEYGLNPPAVGTLLLRSTIVFTGNSIDTVKYFSPPGSNNLVIKPNYKFTGLTVFNRTGNQFEEPRNYVEAYRFFEGKQWNGNPWINPITGNITKLLYSGDPVTGTGWVATVGDETRTMISFGNISIVPNDTHSIIIAQVIARGTSNLNSITKLRELSDYVQSIYDDNFQSVLSISNISNEIPEKFLLNQNYPNPFNPMTIINYQLRITDYVVMKVFDVNGKEVSTLVNEVQSAGSYEVEFDGSKLSSGIYFYKLEARDFSETKRMILLK